MTLDANGNPIEEAQQQVAGAVSNVGQAAEQAPTAALETLLTSVKDVLGGVQTELKRANDLAEKAATTPAAPPAEPAAAPPAEPEVAVEVPKAERFVRRGNRKVKR